MRRWWILAAVAVVTVYLAGGRHIYRQTVIAVPSKGDDPRPLLFPNNTNTILQKDSFGNYQNIAYYDPDGGLFLGPGADPRTTILANVPINLFRRHVFLDFEEADGLDPRCRFAMRGSTSARSEMGLFRVRTGIKSASWGELLLPNVSAPAYAGQRLYFYLRTYPAGNLRLTFGLRHPEREAVAVSFSRTDRGGSSGRGGHYLARTANGEGQSTETDTRVGASPGGDTVRRLFAINILKAPDAARRQTGAVEFYVGTDGGVLERKAIHTTHIPAVTQPDGKTQHLVPFLRLENNADVDQGLDVDVIYAVLIR